MRHALKRTLGVVTTLAYAATLAACSAQQTPAVATMAPVVANSTSVGKLEILRSGSGLLVRLINPKDGAAGTEQSYQTERANCNGHEHPCYIFAAIDGQAPLPVSAGPCAVDNLGGVPTAFCKAAGVSSVTIDAPTGGTIGYDASSPSELGKHCFPSSLIYEVGNKDVYSVLAYDGCKETIRCAGKNVGTVDADSKDVIEGPCYFVDRH
jgi:hypothetical protein